MCVITNSTIQVHLTHSHLDLFSCLPCPLAGLFPVILLLSPLLCYWAASETEPEEDDPMFLALKSKKKKLSEMCRLEGQSKDIQWWKMYSTVPPGEGKQGIAKREIWGRKAQGSGKLCKTKWWGKRTSALHDPVDGFAFSHAETPNIRIREGKIMLNCKGANTDFL